MNKPTTPFELLEAMINNEIRHAQMNDHHMEPDLLNHNGEPAVKIKNIQAAIEGAKRHIAELPKEPTYTITNCTIIGKNKDGSDPFQMSTYGNPPITHLDKIVLNGWILLGPKGADDLLKKIGPEINDKISQNFQE